MHVPLRGGIGFRNAKVSASVTICVLDAELQQIQAQQKVMVQAVEKLILKFKCKQCARSFEVNVLHRMHNANLDM